MISKPNNKFSDLHFLIHSNENTTPIVKLSLKYFDKYIGLDNINITVMSNKFLDDSNLPYKDQVNYVAGVIVRWKRCLILILKSIVFSVIKLTSLE